MTGGISHVLREFHRHGAPESVMYDAKPHVGTDVLSRVVKSIREEIVSLGGELRFNTRLEGLALDATGAGNGRAGRLGRGGIRRGLLRARPRHGPQRARHLRNAARARRTHGAEGLFARRAHRAQPGRAGHGAVRRPARENAARGGTIRSASASPAGGGVYSFCMCPGGEVIAAASEPGGVVTNGMSYSGRAMPNCNSALLVGVTPADFPHPGPLGGVEWQREIERRAFAYAGGDYRAPAQLVADFLENRASTGPARWRPATAPAYVGATCGAFCPGS